MITAVKERILNMIIGLVLFLLGLALMWLGVKDVLQAEPFQTFKHSFKLKSVLQTAQQSHQWRILQIGVISWTLGTMLLVYQLSHKDDAHLKRCLAACQEQGFSKVKWRGFCRCIDGLRYLDIELPASAPSTQERNGKG